MRHIIRGNPGPSARRACEIALQAHQHKFGDYAPRSHRMNYRIEVDSQRFSIEVMNRQHSYVATAMTGHRRLGSMPLAV